MFDLWWQTKDVEAEDFAIVLAAVVSSHQLADLEQFVQLPMLDSSLP